jgi:hypothetical protein
MDHRAILPAVLLVLSLTACAQQPQEETVPRPDIMAVVDTHAPQLMTIPGVTAVAVGALDSGEPCVRIYVVELTDELQAQLPATLEGWPVDVEESGEIRPLGS